MNKEEFKNLYKVLFEDKEQQKQKNIFLTDITIQDTKFSFFKDENHHYLCKFNFQFLDQAQQVTVEFKGKQDLKFKIDDINDSEEIYDLKKFKEYFNPQFQLFKEAFTKFKEFLSNKSKLKREKNNLHIVPLETILNSQQNKQTNITIDGIVFTINEIEDTFDDTYRVDFQLNQADDYNTEKYVVAVFKNISKQNFYIMNFYLNKQQNDLENANIIDKDQFAKIYPTYFESLNKAITTFLNMND